MWLGLASLPMLPQHRAKLLKLGGVNIKGRALIYGGVQIDTVAPDKVFIGNNAAITAGTKILTHYLDQLERVGLSELARYISKMMFSLG